jgi:hypothetical protein
MAILAEQTFTNQADQPISLDGFWEVAVNVTVHTLSGDDIITGTGSNSGILNFGTIKTGNGNDTVDALGNRFIGSGTTDHRPRTTDHRPRQR